MENMPRHEGQQMEYICFLHVTFLIMLYSWMMLIILTKRNTTESQREWFRKPEMC